MIPLREWARAPRGAVLACALAASCGSGDPYDATVLAAASLSEAFTEIAASYERAYPGAEVALVSGHGGNGGVQNTWAHATALLGAGL